MKKFQDKSGWVRAAVCCAVLITQYGIRDTLLTAIPTIAADGDYKPFVNDTVTTSSPENTTTDIDTWTDFSLTDNDMRFASNRPLYRESYDHENTEYVRLSLEVGGLSESESQEIVEIKSEPRQIFLPLSRFWEKLSVRNAGPLTPNLQEREEESSISHPQKYLSFLPSATDVSQKGENFLRKIINFIRTRNDWKREDKSEFIIEDDNKIPITIQEENFSPPLKENWSIMIEGVVLSSVYWGWLITALLAELIISKLGASLVMTLSVTIGGLIGILTHPLSLGSPWLLLSFRIILGAAQGLCYPAITKSLQGVPESSRMAASSIVFLGPSLGTCAGVGLGSLKLWYIATYVMGALALPLIPLCLMLPNTKDKIEKSVPVSRLLKSGGVWACLVVYVANIFTLHTVLVGLPLCLTYTNIDRPSMSGVVVLSLVLAVALVVRAATGLSPLLTGRGPLTVLNRRRLPIIIGSLLMLIAVIVMATAGLEAVDVLAGLAVGGVGLGVAMTRFGVRVNLEDLAPWTLPRLMHVVNIVGVFTAVWPPLMVGGLAEVSDEGVWVAIWLIPLAVIVPSAGVYAFLLTANPQPWDEAPSEGPKMAGASNGVGPPRDTVPAARGFDARMSFKSARSGLSFKSAHSSQTFKTAVSRRRSRSPSCRTIDEDLSVDMRSVIEEDEDGELQSIEGSIQECKSVASSNTFKSDGADMHSIDLNDQSIAGNQQQSPSQMYPGSPADRTSAWLNYHHQVPIENVSHSPPTKADTRRRNAIYDLFW